MSSYYTRAKARGEQEDVEQGDSALEMTTTTVSDRANVGLKDASTEGLESMSTEVVGPMSTHPQLLPEGDHSTVGGHGILGSASSSLVGVSTLGYPSGLADPLVSSIASEGQITAVSSITTATATTSSNNEVVTSRQTPTVAVEVTAAAFSSPTHVYFAKNVAYFPISLILGSVFSDCVTFMGIYSTKSSCLYSLDLAPSPSNYFI